MRTMVIKMNKNLKSKNLKERDNLGNQGVDGNMIL
jgi:hypothetical protein